MENTLDYVENTLDYMYVEICPVKKIDNKKALIIQRMRIVSKLCGSAPHILSNAPYTGYKENKFLDLPFGL